MSKRKCAHDKNDFCYICGHFISHSSRKRQIMSNSQLISAYNSYFGLSLLQDMNKPWAPDYVCSNCYSNLLGWRNGLRKKMPFGIPRVWREQINHSTDCYFCLAYIGSGKQKSIYPNISSSRAPVPHCDEIPIPSYPAIDNAEATDESSNASDTSSVTSTSELVTIKCVNQTQFDSFVRRLQLSKNGSEEFRKILNELGVLHRNVTYRHVRDRSSDLESFFVMKKMFRIV